MASNVGFPDSSNSRLLRGIPSFKLMDDERAGSKRLRNRVPSAGGRCDTGSSEGEASMSSLLFKDTPRSPTQQVAPGPRRVSSFTLANDVFRSMSHTSSWGSGAGSNMFNFGPASIDGEDEDNVRRLDDASFNDLDFLTMEGVGPSEEGTGTSQKESPSEAGLDTKLLENRAAVVGEGFDRYAAESYGGGHLQSTVKEEIGVNAIVGRNSLSSMTSTRDLLGRNASGRDVLGVSSMGRKDSSRGILGGDVFGLEGGVPIFSSPVEDFFSHQLEAAEQSIGRSPDSGRAFRDTVNGGNSGGGGDNGSEETSSALIGVVGGAGRSSTLQSAVVKSQGEFNLDGPSVAPQGATSFESSHVNEGDFEPGDIERRTRYGNYTQQQEEQQEEEHEPLEDESDGEAESSQSEYEPPAPREGKVHKARGRARAVAATASPTAKPGGCVAGGRAAIYSRPVFRRGSLKRQTSEDVAARLPLEILERYYHVPLNIAANQLKVSLTMLKKLCRTYGVKRWPHRQVSSLDKTTSRLEEKIKARKDSGKEAPSLKRKLTQAKKRRSVIIKTASAGLDATVLNSIFTSRPGDIDEDLLLASTDVAKAVEQIQSTLEIDHKKSESGSDSHDTDDGDSDNYDSDEDAAGMAVEKPPCAISSSKKITSAMDMLADLPFSSSPCASVDATSTPPPAFEPGSSTKSATAKKSAIKKPADKKSTAASKRSVAKKAVAKKPATKKTVVKTEIPATPARKVSKNAAASPTKGLTAMTAAARSASSAGVMPSVLPKDDMAASLPPAVSLPPAASPGSYISDGSGLDNPIAGSTLAASSPPSASFGSSARARAPMIGYSSVFGVGLQHQVSGNREGSTATAGKGSGGGSSGQPRNGESAHPNAQQGARVPAWVGKGYREWRGASDNLRQHVSDGRSDSPTTAATLDSFNLKLSLESPPRGALSQSSAVLAPPPPPPPPPPSHDHPFAVHQPFPHHHQQPPCYNHINWAGGGYPSGRSHHQCYGFPVEFMSPVDTRYPPHGSGSRGGYAFSRVDDTTEAVRGVNAAPSNEGEAAACEKSDDGPQGTAAAAAAAAAATAAGATPTVSEEAAPRRTGFMSYLLHQAPTSPPLGSCPSPVAPPTAPVGTFDAEY